MLSIVGKITLRNNKVDDTKVSSGNNGSKFKPVNHEETLEFTNELSKINEKQETSGPNSTSDDNKKTTLQKSRSFGTSSCQLRTR